MSPETTPSDPSSISVRDERAALVEDISVRGPAFGRAYAALVDAWLTQLLGDVDGVALVAVGGYGRRELAPASDLDVLLLHNKVRNVDEIANRLWYPIWDQGFRLDHSVRTVREAIGVAQDDLKAAIGLLDARCVAGDESMVETLSEKARAQWRKQWKSSAPALEQEAKARDERPGPVAFLLEPDLKEGSGGRRDITMFRALAAAGVPGVEATPAFDEAADLLFGVRVGLQRVSGRQDDRLLLEYQDRVAALLDIADADELMRQVAAAARTISWTVDGAFRRVDAAIAGPRARSFGGRDQVLAPGLVRRDGEVVLLPDTQARDATLLLQAAAEAATSGLPIARNTLDRFRDDVVPLNGPWTDEARDAFVALLGSGERAVDIFETLDQYDLVSRILPEWAPVRSRPQRNAFHRFTVDRHLVEAVVQASRLLSRVTRGDLLLVGAWLHDLGKGYPGDHTDAGVTLMRTIAIRMGYEPEDVETLVGLVRSHLLLPSVATSRDLDDPATIAGVATTVGDVEFLDLLWALTEADSLATGPTAWTSWKAGLIETLVAKVRAALEGEPHVATLAAPSADAALVERANGFIMVEGTAHHLVVVAPDQPRLFSRVVGLLALNGHDVRGARARSIGATAISEYDIQPHLGELPDWSRFEEQLGEALAGEIALGEGLTERAERYGALQRPTAARLPETRVIIDNDASSTATVLEVHAVDETGVLYRIARVLAEQRLDIRHAKVSTLGLEAIDTFYVVDADERKITEPTRVADLTAAVSDAVRPEQTEAVSGSSQGRVEPA